MSKQTAQFLLPWVKWVINRPGLTLILVSIVTAVLGFVAVTQFKMNSNLSELIDQNASWRSDFDQFEKAFPDLVRTSVIVLSSKSIYHLEQSTAQIVDALQARPDKFRAISAPGSEDFFRDHAFLYMDIDSLDDVADQLAQAQPWLSAVSTDASLKPILELVKEGIEADPPEGFNRVLELLATSAEGFASEGQGEIYWTNEFFDNPDVLYQLIFVKPQLVNGVRPADAVAVADLRDLLGSMSMAEEVEVRLTGEIPLQHEEIQAAVSGVSLAGWLSLALLFIVLAVGVRSFKIIAATFLMLTIGVIWTSAYAMLTVGEYNTLSLVFIVMFFGLGVDFALHYSLRYQEAINAGDVDVGEALLKSTSSVGRAISLCTLTTALGFLGFWPTDYQGLADLGVISAGGMVVAWFLTFTFLPAFYAFVKAPSAHQMDLPTSDRVVSALINHRPWVLIGISVIGLCALWGASQSSFDYSTLALKDEQSESMSTLRELQREGLSTDYQLVVLSDGDPEVELLMANPHVKEVNTPFEFVPNNQEDKLFVIEDLQTILWDLLDTQQTQSSDVPAVKKALSDLLEFLQQHQLPDNSVVDNHLVARLQTALSEIQQQPNEKLLLWQQQVTSNLLQELERIRRALQVGEVALEHLPDSILERLISKNGLQLTTILPAQDIADVDNLSGFINSVKAIEPQATGRPVIEWGVGQIVQDSFRMAVSFAIVAIGCVLLVALRSLGTVLLILLPLGLTALCALAFGVLFDQAVNMASILVLPLIFGLGVDNGIHVVDRYLGEGDVEHLMHSSTPRAVMLSTLTTIGAFSALSLSPHAGTASIGLLLTVSVGFLLLFTVFLLPVLLSSRSVRQDG